MLVSCSGGMGKATAVCGTCSATGLELVKALPHSTMVIDSSRYGLLGSFVRVMRRL